MQCSTPLLRSVRESALTRRRGVTWQLRRLCHHAQPGLFGIDGLHTADDLTQLTHKTVDDCGKLHARLLAGDDARPCVPLLDDLSNVLCLTADTAECVRLLHPDTSWRRAAFNTANELGRVVDTFNTDTNIYNALKVAVEADGVDQVDRRVGRLLLDDFEDSGVHLDAENKDEFVRLNGVIFEEGAECVGHAHQPTIVNASHPMASELSTIADVKGGSLVLRHAGSNSHDPAIRQTAYNLFYGVDHDRIGCLNRMINARHQLAQLTGFQSYAHRATQRMLLNTPDSIESFLVTLADSLRPLVADELDVVERLLHCRPTIADLPYAQALMRNHRLGKLKRPRNAAFDVHTIVESMNAYISRTFNTTLVASETAEGEVPVGMRKYTAVEKGVPRTLGVIYVDLMARDGKEGGDCHMTVRCSKSMPDGRRQQPIVVLSLSLRGNECMHHELGNIWHEIGHAIHSMTAQTRHQHVSGTRCSTDMAEVPSTLMEYALADPRVMQIVYPHMHEDDVKTLNRADNVFPAIQMQQQVIHSLFDLRLHYGPSSPSMVEEYNKLEAHYMHMGAQSNVFWPIRFGHIVPYGAKYSSYLVANASASLIWHKLFNDDPFCQTAGEARITNMQMRKGAKWLSAQSYGGERPMDELVGELLGEEVNAELLAEALQREMKQKHECALE